MMNASKKPAVSRADIVPYEARSFFTLRPANNAMSRIRSHAPLAEHGKLPRPGRFRLQGAARATKLEYFESNEGSAPHAGRNDAKYFAGAWQAYNVFKRSRYQLAGKEYVKTTAYGLNSDSVQCSGRIAGPLYRLRSIPTTISKGIRATMRLLTRMGR